MLGRDVVVLHALGVTLGGIEGIDGGLRQANFHVAALHLGTFVQLSMELFAEGEGAAGDPGDQGGDDTFVLIDEGEQEVSRLDGLMTVVLGKLLGLKDGLLGFLGEFIEFHRLLLTNHDPSLRGGTASQARSDTAYNCKPRR